MSWQKKVRKRIRKRLTRPDHSRTTVMHAVGKEVRPPALVSRPAEDHGERVGYAERLIQAFRTAVQAEKSAPLPQPTEDLWTGVVNREFKELLEILHGENAPALAHYLQHFGEDYFAFGGLTLTLDAFAKKSEVSLSYLDKLVCLAESLGTLAVENPESSQAWGRSLLVDIDTVIDDIETAIGVPMLPPRAAVPVTGIASRRGPVHYRHINSLYAALRQQALLSQGDAVCEYGGGIGLVAHYARTLGLRDYTLYDLPLVNVFAGHFLINTLGPDAVRLYGEDDADERIHVLPFWECMNAPDDRFALSINQDSFPEIDPGLVREYLRQIERTSKKYFLSINHESRAPMGTRLHNLVPELTKERSGFKRLYRMPYWLRKGYVEELYQLPSAAL